MSREKNTNDEEGYTNVKNHFKKCKYISNIEAMTIKINTFTCEQVILLVGSQPKAATFSQVTTIIQEATKLRMFGKRTRILLDPCCKVELCVVVRYHSCPPFLVSMSVQNGAIILWEPFIGKGCDVYSVSGVANVTSPLLFTFENNTTILLRMCKYQIVSVCPEMNCCNRFDFVLIIFHTK